MPTPRRFYAVLTLIAALAIASCHEPATSAVAPKGAAPEESLLGSLLTPSGLLSCRAQPYDSASAIIGSTGGTIHVGVATLQIPAGALSQSVLITAVTPSGSVNLVQFQPQGLQFQRPAALTISYANCSLLARLLPGHIAYTDDDLHILELLPAVLNLLRQSATSNIGHFSGYAIAW